MNFLKSIFSEKDGKGSWGRCGGTLVLGWCTYLVFYNHSMPDLTGPAALIGVIYGLSAAKAVIPSVVNNKQS